MRAPRFIRKFIATIIAWYTPGVGGTLWDYKNGMWDQLYTWSTGTDTEKQAVALTVSMVERERDEIYVVMTRGVNFRSRPCGFLCVYTPTEFYYRAFCEGTYNFVEAYGDTVRQCRKIADKMGFRRPE